MSLSIRELGLTGQTELESLLDALHPDWRASAPGSTSGPMAFLADRASFVFGAWKGEEPVGMLWGVHVLQPDGRTMTYVHELDVAESARRQGIASLLMEAAIGNARRKGSFEVWLATEDDNDPANALYDGLGGTREAATIWAWDLS